MLNLPTGRTVPGAVRGFARHESVADPRPEIPTTDLLPTGPRRTSPHTYSDKEVADLIPLE